MSVVYIISKGKQGYSLPKLRIRDPHQKERLNSERDLTTGRPPTIFKKESNNNLKTKDYENFYFKPYQNKRYYQF